jgi:diguanylate cyclase
MTNDKIDRTYEIMRQAVPLMVKHRIPVTGENYAVWYKYVSGTDEDLRRAIEALVDGKAEFTEEQNAALFGQFCQKGDERELQKIREDLKVVMDSLIGQTHELTGQAEQCDSYLCESVAILKETSTIQEIRNVVDQIAVRTKTLAKFGKAMKYRLEASLEALSTMKEDFEHVKTEAAIDYLTGLSNRKTFFETLSLSCKDASRHGGALSLLFVDVDHFKRVNDQFGHLIGDEVLKFVAAKIRDTVRQTDFVGRYGGEEFAVIMPRASLDTAQIVAERIRSRFAQSQLKATGTSQHLGVITVSVGVAQYHRGEAAEELVDRADKALYLAKSSGRNCVATDGVDIACTG